MAFGGSWKLRRSFELLICEPQYHAETNSVWSTTPRPFDGDDVGLCVYEEGEEEEEVADSEEVSVYGNEIDSDDEVAGYELPT